jgi:hypothetical protein
LEKNVSQPKRLAVAGATNAQLDRAEADMRGVEDRAKTSRAALVEFDEQIVSTERALAEPTSAPNPCKVCSDQQAACIKNYAGPTCKTEFQMCTKSCRKK